jgi:hypothetical protein
MFFIVAAIFLLLSFTDLSQQAIDIALGDTYIVLGINQICWFLSIYLALLGFGLRHLRKIERPIKPIWQSAYWSISIILIFVVAWIMHQSTVLPKTIRFDDAQFKKVLFLNRVLSIAVVTFLLIQIGFVVMVFCRGFRRCAK